MRFEYSNHRYLATEVDTGKYVLWTEIVVGDKDLEMIQTWVQFAMAFLFLIMSSCAGAVGLRH